MAERRPTNSELKLRRLEDEEPKPADDRGILELFEDSAQPDEDRPLARDDDAEDAD
ncbi:MAG TPA: hypothetical protein VHD91_04855 [Gaiellaceae bacterium]|nr:hypothetical protein [Gaiellaceae bacterium]